MTRSHWVTLALFLGSLAGLVNALHSWAEAMSPPFIGGVLGLMATIINASFGDSPRETNAVTRTMGTVVQKISGD
jgi:hypothetical protein